ncbi:MAG TPA: isochorismatase family protein [Microthrixaceae bacterium]|nr:isochorismatase family protein [Microthrixaceae bacterium]
MTGRIDEQTALVVVDVQNDFAHPDGSLYVEGGEHVVDGINELVREVRQAGGLVVYTQDWHPPETPHFEAFGGTWPVHCVRDTWGAQLHDDLVVDGPVVRKGTGGEDGYSGFTVRHVHTGHEQPTELEQLLRDHGIERVIVVGLAQDVCVKATAIDAASLGFDTTVPLGLTRGVNVEPGDDERANQEMAAAGVHLEPA